MIDSDMFGTDVSLSAYQIDSFDRVTINVHDADKFRASHQWRSLVHYLPSTDVHAVRLFTEGDDAIKFFVKDLAKFALLLHAVADDIDDYIWHEANASALKGESA